MSEPTWDTTYLLGWYDRNGRPFLTTWSGDLPMVHVVVTGCTPMRMPLWNAPVPPSAALREVPFGKDPQEYARELGGFYAFGWRVEKVERKEAR